MNKKQITIQGNDITADILCLIAPDDWKINKVSTSQKKRLPYPFYANDITNGILKCFARRSGLLNVSDFKKTVQNIVVVTDNSKYFFPCSFEGFFEALIEQFPKERDGLCKFYNIIKLVGTEWKNWIASEFSGSITGMKHSSKYNRYTLNDLEFLFDIHNSEIRNILYSFIPKKDATISVIGGYLFTQCFDVNAYREDIFQWIHEQAQARLTVLQNSIGNPFETNILIDSTNQISVGAFLHTSSGYGEFSISGSNDILMDKIYYVYNSKYWIRVWNRRSLNQKADDEWAFEYILFSQCTNEEYIITELIKTLFQKDMLSIRYYHNDSIVKSFSTTVAGGFSWAFNPSESMRDPMNIFKIKSSEQLSYGHWGYAWFAASFDLYRQLNKFGN